MFANWTQHHPRNARIDQVIYALVGRPLHPPTLGNISKGWCALGKWHWPIGGSISCGMSIGWYQHQLTDGIISQGLSTSGNRHKPTTRTIGKVIFVLDYRIGPDLCTSLKGRQAWTTRISRGLCKQLNGSLNVLLPASLSYIQQPVDIERRKLASVVTCTFLNQYRPWNSR